LPEAIDDYVEADNPVRFIDAFVEGLDLAGAGFARVEAKATGRPGYAPGDLLKLYIYGYLNRVRSSRRLERGAQRNIEVIWLLRGLIRFPGDHFGLAILGHQWNPVRPLMVSG
jgi:transposase